MPPLQHKLVCVSYYTLTSLLPSIVLLYLGELPPFMSRMSWEFHHLLRILGIVILPTSTILSWSPYWLTGNINEWTMMLGFCTSSNLIALKLMVDSSFLDYWLSNCHCNIDRATYSRFPGAPFYHCSIVYVFIEHTSLYHLVWLMLSPCSHNCGNHLLLISMNFRWVHQPRPRHFLGLMMNSCFRTRFHSSFPRILQCLLDNWVAPFFSGIMSLRYPDS